MDDPKEGGLLTPDDAAGLPTGSIRDIIPYVVFLSLFLDFTILSAIFLQEIKGTATAMPRTSIIPTLSQFSVSSLSTWR